MKKFISIIAIAFALFGTTTTANAQYHSNEKVQTIKANPDWAYDHCRDNVLRGDEEFRRGAWNTAQWYYELALKNNRDCPTRKYISDAELNRKLDEVEFARRHNGMTRRQYEEEQERKARVAIATAIASAKTNNNNRNNNSNINAAAQATPAVANNATELRHYDNNGISYDANSSLARITGVEKTATATIVHFEFLNLNSESSISISFGTYLKDKATGKKLILTDTDGIYTNNRLKVEAGDSHDFTLTFPAVSEDCKSIDIVEPGQTGWKFYHINL